MRSGPWGLGVSILLLLVAIISAMLCWLFLNTGWKFSIIALLTPLILMTQVLVKHWFCVRFFAFIIVQSHKECFFQNAPQGFRVFAQALNFVALRLGGAFSRGACNKRGEQFHLWDFTLHLVNSFVLMHSFTRSRNEALDFFRCNGLRR
jgi:hypothetical protein